MTAPDNLLAMVEAKGFIHLPLTFHHAEQAGNLPMHHRDPVDRMLIAQAPGPKGSSSSQEMPASRCMASGPSPHRRCTGFRRGHPRPRSRMSPSPYTEDTLVQQTTAEYLEERLGWESVYAHNHEDYGPDSLLGRASDREVVLTRPLRERLAALNPDLPDAAYDDAVRQIAATTVHSAASQGIAAANREKHALMRDGVRVTFRNRTGELMHERLRVLDFDEPANNHFLCVRELWVRGSLYRRPGRHRGLRQRPAAAVRGVQEHPPGSEGPAFERNYSDYRDTVPHLFHHNAVVMFGNGEKARIGSITSGWDHFHEWKRLAEEEPGAVDMETLLKGVCDKRSFMDLVESFIVFDESSGELRKILARNHQFLGVNRAVEAVRERKARQGGGSSASSGTRRGPARATRW